MKTEKFWRIASKKLTFLGKNKLAQKLKRLKKTGMCFYYFYIISPYSKNPSISLEHSIKYKPFFSEEYVPKSRDGLIS